MQINFLTGKRNLFKNFRENNEDSCLAERIYPESALARQEQITDRGGRVVLQSRVKYLFYNAAPLINFKDRN